MKVTEAKKATYESKPVQQAIGKINEIIAECASKGLSSYVISHEYIPEGCGNAIEKLLCECGFTADMCSDGLHIRWIEY